MTPARAQAEAIVSCIRQSSVAHSESEHRAYDEFWIEKYPIAVSSIHCEPTVVPYHGPIGVGGSPTVVRVMGSCFHAAFGISLRV